MSCKDLEIVIKPNHYFVVGPIRCDESFNAKGHSCIACCNFNSNMLFFLCCPLCVLFVLIKIFVKCIVVVKMFEKLDDYML